MALTIQQIITARAPQYATDSRLSAFIELAQLTTSPAAFGDRYNYAVALRVCHMMALEEIRGATDVVAQTTSGSAIAGFISSEREGSLSRSYSVSSSAQQKYADLANTAFGLELIDLIRGSVFGPRNRAMDSQQGSTGQGFNFGTELPSAGT